jgi:hypothetical protein
MADSKLSKLADELEGLDDEPTGEVHVHMPKGTTLEADATGKLRAVSVHDEDITPHDPPRKVESEAPPSKVAPLTIVWVIVRKFPPWGAVAVALAGIVAYVLLHR